LLPPGRKTWPRALVPHDTQDERSCRPCSLLAYLLKYIRLRYIIVIEILERSVSAIKHELVHLSSGKGGRAVQVGAIQGKIDGQHVASNRTHTIGDANLVVARICEGRIVEPDVT
jgi:hypothetical protein